ncbi:hypothetical protein GR210_01345 [Rhizobium leguminosarum]|uniref:hypothetical protein n=1 Tax=Rhizobium leguminosarum TaxID=384 RepID=UPI0013DB0D7F|nr:hypothetical protein [Rhizobium leguminosarum]NEH47440.1 hypothetical protein [Rhizobium leguminosarum]
MPDTLSNRPNDQPVDEIVVRELYLSSADGDDYDVRPDEMADMVFPVALELQPGESLRDAAYRATEENGYRRTQLAIRLARPLSFKSLSAFTSVAHQEDISRIVDILGIRHDAKQLHKLLANSQVRSRQFVSFFGHHLQRADFSQFRRVSPRALRAAEYQRAIWSVRWLPCDPETMERLIDRCPVCHSNLGWQTTRGVSFCHRCTGPETDLRDFPQPLVECNDPDAMRFVLEILDPLISDGPFGARWPTAYAAKTRAELYQFVVKLAMECQRHEERRRGPVKHVSSKSIERAGRALLDWPAGLLELADKHSEVRNDTRMLRYLQADASLSVAVRADIRALLEVRTRKMALADFQGLEKPPGLAGAAVSSVPRRNARTNLLELVNRPGHVRSGIEVAVRVVRDIRSVRLISHKMGVSVPDVVELYLSGLLGPLHQDMSAIGIGEEVQHNQFDIMEWIEANVPIARKPDGLSLVAAKFALDPSHSLSWAVVLDAAIKGELNLQRGRGCDQSVLHNLYVDNFDGLTALLDLPQRPNRFADVFLTSSEVAMTMGKSRAIAAVLSKHFQWHSAATLGKLIDLRRSYAFSFELTDLCFISEVKTPKVFTVLQRAEIPHILVEKMVLWQRDAALECLSLC